MDMLSDFCYLKIKLLCNSKKKNKHVAMCVFVRFVEICVDGDVLKNISMLVLLEYLTCKLIVIVKYCEMTWLTFAKV